MTIFLDTDTLSYFFMGKVTIREKILEAMNQNHQLCLTCINVYEIIKGLKYRGNKNKEQDFYRFLENMSVFYFSHDAIQIAGDIYSNLRKKGITIGDADILIASIVIANKGILITNNTKHYQHINNLSLENWFQAT